MTAIRGSALVRVLMVVFAIGAWPGIPAWGQARTDVIRLANGDRVTGEIMHLERGRLELKTDDAGTIDFEWDNVASVESTRQFEIATSDGRRLLGSLQPATERFILIATTEGDVTLPIPETTTLYPIGASFWAKVNGSVNMGFNYTRSSGIAQLNLNTETTFRRPAFVVSLETSATLTDQSGGERDDRGYLELGYVRYRGRRWLIGGAASFENNESLGVVLRSQAGGMVGQRLVNTNKAQLELGAGLVGNNEQGVDTPATQNLEAALTLSTSVLHLRRIENQLRARLQLLPQPVELGPSAAAVRQQLHARVVEELFLFNRRVRLVRQRPAVCRRRSQRRGRRDLDRLDLLTAGD